MDPWEGDLSDPQSLNRYSYVRNNPLRYVDPTGKLFETIVDLAITTYDSLKTAKNTFESAVDSMGLLWNLYVEKDYEAAADYANSYDNNIGELKAAAIDLTVDAGATLVPFVPAGLTKVTKAADKINDAKKSTPIWTKGPYKNSVDNARKHWENHGSDFPEIKNAKQYAEEAKKFLQKPPKNSFKYTRENGDKIIYNNKTNTFGVKDKQGTPKTFFKPKEGLKYFYKQKKK